MFKKVKPYLCWGSIPQQTAIEKQNEKLPENHSSFRHIEVENITVDESYLPTTKV